MEKKLAAPQARKENEPKTQYNKVIIVRAA